MNVPSKPDHRLTYAEYVLLPDDGNQHEIIDGVYRPEAHTDRLVLTQLPQVAVELATVW